MRVPQVSERVKEAPAHALRAVFAGIGQVLLVADRMRNRPQDTKPPGPASSPSDQAPAPATPAAATSPAAAPVPGPLPLPLPGYDELTVASLRARMRVLNPAQLRTLIDYENSHAGRADVVSMFERRIAKIEAGGPGLAG